MNFSQLLDIALCPTDLYEFLNIYYFHTIFIFGTLAYILLSPHALILFLEYLGILIFSWMNFRFIFFPENSTLSHNPIKCPWRFLYIYKWIKRELTILNIWTFHSGLFLMFVLKILSFSSQRFSLFLLNLLVDFSYV